MSAQWQETPGGEPVWRERSEREGNKQAARPRSGLEAQRAGCVPVGGWDRKRSAQRRQARRR